VCTCGSAAAATRDSSLDWMRDALHVSNGDATDVPGTGLARRAVYWPRIDRWIGGVHLEGRRGAWRRDDGTETIVHIVGKT
jgi:hypothetical protein